MEQERDSALAEAEQARSKVDSKETVSQVKTAQLMADLDAARHEAVAAQAQVSHLQRDVETATNDLHAALEELTIAQVTNVVLFLC